MRHHPNRRGFTLIELLVVIAIIALLISILLPSMVGARRTGQRVACMANLREISKGATQYATDNDDWIIGSAAGSGSYLLGQAAAFGPAVQVADFMGPMAKMMGMDFLEPSVGEPQVVARRFNDLRSAKAFLCPGNKFLATHFSGPDAGVGWMVSYNTMRVQQWLWQEAGGISGVTTLPSNHSEKLPKNWRPSVGRMGNPSNKVFVADGSRYATTTIAPDYDLRVNAAFGGAFADTGSYSTFSRAWDRNWAVGNTSGVDARYYAFRHSTSEPPQGAKGNTFKMNLAFYDGHVETQGDLDSTKPQQWLPAGTELNTATLWQDTLVQFGLSGVIKIGP